jgi:hypothetical protein
MGVTGVPLRLRLSHLWLDVPLFGRGQGAGRWSGSGVMAGHQGQAVTGGPGAGGGPLAPGAYPKRPGLMIRERGQGQGAGR